MKKITRLNCTLTTLKAINVCNQMVKLTLGTDFELHDAKFRFESFSPQEGGGIMIKTEATLSIHSLKRPEFDLGGARKMEVSFAFITCSYGWRIDRTVPLLAVSLGKVAHFDVNKIDELNLLEDKTFART